MSTPDEASIWGMADVVDLLTQIRDKLTDIEEHLATISADTDDISTNTASSDQPVVTAVEEVGRKIDAAALDIMSSLG